MKRYTFSAHIAINAETEAQALEAAANIAADLNIGLADGAGDDVCLAIESEYSADVEDIEDDWEDTDA